MIRPIRILARGGMVLSILLFVACAVAIFISYTRPGAWVVRQRSTYGVLSVVPHSPGEPLYYPPQLHQYRPCDLLRVERARLNWERIDICMKWSSTAQQMLENLRQEPPRANGGRPMETWSLFGVRSVKQAPFVYDGVAYNQWAIPESGIDSLSIPLWPVLILTAVAPCACLIRRQLAGLTRRHRLRNGLCLNCGYDLRATPDRCPECGHGVVANPR